MTLIPFAEELEYSAIADKIRSNDSVVGAHATIIDSFNAWWEAEGHKQILHLRSEGALLHSTAEEMKSAFVVALKENEIIDDFAIRGAFVEWFNINESTLRTIVETGYPAALIHDENVLSLEHQTLLDRRNQLMAQTEEINTQYDLLSRINRANSGSSNDGEEESSDAEGEGIVEQIGNFIPNILLTPLEEEKKNCNGRIKILTTECKEIHQHIFDREEVKNLPRDKKPPKGGTSPTSTDFHKLDALVDAIDDIAALREIRNNLIAKISEWDNLHSRKNEIVEIMKPHEDHKVLRSELNSSLNLLKEQLFALANEVRRTLPEDFVISEITNQLRASMEFQIQRRLDSNVDQLISLIQSMHTRYSHTLSEIIEERDKQSVVVHELFNRLGYMGDSK